VKRFIYASSCAVYGEIKLPVHEGRLPHPISPYAASKMAAESYAISFYETYGLKTICLRYFNCYDDSEVHDSYSGVIKRFINQLLKNQPPIVYGDGKQTRDFVHVNDVVEANMLVLKNENVAGEVFNVGTGIATSINQLIKILQEIMAKTHLKPIYANPRRGDIRHSCANINKAERILGYKPSISLRDGLVMLVQWYKEKGTYTERVQ
jgi:UDP-glucose 4-epimerase